MIIGLLQNFKFTLQISLCRVWYAAIKCCTSLATYGRFTTCPKRTVLLLVLFKKFLFFFADLRRNKGF